MAELATIARPYAEALFQVARQADVTAWSQQIEALSQVAQNADVRQYADNPRVSADQVFHSVVEAAKVNLLPGVQNFLHAVIDNGRLAVLPEVAEQFHALVNASGGVADAEIYSAYPIEPQQLDEVIAVLEQRFGRKLAASVKLEPELIGGIRVVVGDEVLDTSVKARLDRMKVALSA